MPFKQKTDRAAYMRQYRQRKKGPPPDPPPAPAGDPGTVACDWISQTLKIPTGPKMGEPFLLPNWQRDFIVAALGPGIREAGISVARKNGKSGAIAALFLACLVGPLNAPLWRGIVVSLTGQLAAELRDAITQTAEASGLDHLLNVRRSPPPGSIEGLQGAKVTILASDKATGHAIGADLAVIDEAGLIPESGRDLWNAILASTSGRDGCLLCISIRGDSPMFSELAERRDRPGVVFHEWAAPEGCALDDRDAWTAANPGLETGIKSTEYMVDMSARAIVTPADSASFRAMDLNQPQSPSRELLCDVSDWLACEVEELPPRTARYVVGLDIGGSSSLTAAFALFDNGRAEVWTACGDTPDLLTRGRADGVGGRYQQMEDRGELKTYPGRVTPVADFLRDVAESLGRTPEAVAADRYRKAEVEDLLQSAGLTWSIQWRGTGASSTADGSHDVRAFQRMVLGKRLKVMESLVLRSSISESSIRYDSGGNPALDKLRSKSRIDALQAGVLAASLWESMLSRPKRRRPRLRVI